MTLQKLNKSGVGCRLGNMFCNNLSFADDMSLLAPSGPALQKLLAICEDYASDHDIVYNVKKSVCMYFKSKNVKCVNNPKFYLNNAQIQYVNSYVYLGHMVNDKLCDNDDIMRQRRAICIRSNMIISQIFCLFCRCKKAIVPNILY